MITMSDDQLWDVLLDAGLTEADVVAVVRMRVVGAVEAAKAAVDRLETTAVDCDSAFGISVPADSRRGYGPTVSQRDLDGAQRVLAAITQPWQDDVIDPPVEAIGRTALRHLARRASAGDGDGLAFLVEQARKQQAMRGAGTCRECGCIDLMGCKGGCSWVDDSHTLCSTCVSSPGAQAS